MKENANIWCQTTLADARIVQFTLTLADKIIPVESESLKVLKWRHHSSWTFKTSHLAPSSSHTFSFSSRIRARLIHENDCLDDFREMKIYLQATRVSQRHNFDWNVYAENCNKSLSESGIRVFRCLVLNFFTNRTQIK